MQTHSRLLLVGCLWMLGCAASNTKGDDAGGVGAMGAGTGGTSGINAGSGGSGVGGNGGGGSGGFGISNTVSLCGGVECADGEECCLLNAQCFNPTTNAASCTVPANTPPDPNGATRCASNKDCGPNEMCGQTADCSGVGSCTTRDNCGSCGGPNGPCAVCGCDGVTYLGIDAACAAGVRIQLREGACGESRTLGGGGSGGAIVTITYCGADGQCPSGERCCTRTGECFDPAKPALCDPPPMGSYRGCYSDADCYSGVCLGDGCDGPGGCRSVGGSCSSVLNPVCGCDGQTYTNAECARSEGIRIASSGNCM